jgi:hypothetical protein
MEDEITIERAIKLLESKKKSQDKFLAKKKGEGHKKIQSQYFAPELVDKFLKVVRDSGGWKVFIEKVIKKGKL